MGHEIGYWTSVGHSPAAKESDVIEEGIYARSRLMDAEDDGVPSFS